MTQESVLAILQELGGIIRHELGPPIGWIRYAATSEISDYESSETKSHIEALRRRVDGLASLAAAHRLPQRVRMSLGELLEESVPADVSPGLFSMDIPDDIDDGIETDPGLFTVLLSNAMQNAVDAGREPDETEAVVVAVGLSVEEFWIRISNHFSGASFEFADVAASGVSTKTDHRGLGLRIMKLAAERLGYQIDLSGAGEVATFFVRGKRRYV